MYAIRSYYETCNDKNGRLVRGANWADRRPVDRSHNVSQSLFAKAFINPDDQHCTLGFRYVMKVKMKDEDKIVKKIKVLGRNIRITSYNVCYTKLLRPQRQCKHRQPG